MIRKTKKPLALLLAALLLFCSLSLAPAVQAANEPYICLGYVADWTFNNQSGLAKIDFTKLTHVNFAFSLVGGNSASLPSAANLIPTIDSPNKITMLKNEIARQGADTKILLSIGGWGADWFCPAAKTAQSRATFAAECQRLVTTYGLDGIDLDWEYPGVSVYREGFGFNTQSCSTCNTDYTQLCQAIRTSIGNGKLLTMAGGASAQRANALQCSQLAGLLDFVNLMNYDYNETNHASFNATIQAAQAWVSAGFTKK
ncbi:MAG: hypothetical protein LBS74_03780, partial [Oscillospiraceae bacterium]|nr:hypothetical protein [Oscillospiraceae bacterium]